MPGWSGNSSMDKRYEVVYTESAIRDLEEKADYITGQLREPKLAEVWYLRLRAELQNDLAYFPSKYPFYHVEKWRTKGVRLLTFRNDVILYSVDEEKREVIIWAICTKGRDLVSHLERADEDV